MARRILVNAMFFNGSPRKHFNTAQLLEKAMEGAREASAETELVHLYDYEFTGCRSCFACKVKNSKTNGVCAVRDSIRPIIERAQEADVIVIGSPVYFGYPTGQVRNLVERLLFPLDTYLVDEQGAARQGAAQAGTNRDDLHNELPRMADGAGGLSEAARLHRRGDGQALRL